MKKILSALVAILLLCGMAFAETEPMAEDDMMQLIGMTIDELADKFEGLYKEVYHHPDATYAYPEKMQIKISCEGGTETGWDDQRVFEVCLRFDPTYCLDGYRVGLPCKEQAERAVNEGWVPVKDESKSDTFKVWYEKTVDNAVYTLFLFCDSFENPEWLAEMVTVTVMLTDTAE